MGTEDDEAVAARVGAAIDDAVSSYGPAVADILASYKDGIAELLAAMDALAGTEGCVRAKPRVGWRKGGRLC